MRSLFHAALYWLSGGPTLDLFLGGATLKMLVAYKVLVNPHFLSICTAKQPSASEGKSSDLKLFSNP